MLTLLLLVPATAVHAAENIDKSQLNSGIVSINYQPASNVPTKVMISKGGLNYTYNLDLNSRLPLQSGDGEYIIYILENVAGNKYKVVKQEKITASLPNKNAVYLQSIQLINWNEDMEIIKKAKELAVNTKDDQEKLTAIYNYIVNNISYDYQKATQLSADYIPSIAETSKTGQGICYDYAALTAAMLRSVGIPTKLIMGYKNDIQEYHAWNQVYLQDSNEWVTIDTTYDSILVQNKVPVTMPKDVQEYSAAKQY